MTTHFQYIPAVFSEGGCILCRTEEADGPGVQQEKSVQVEPSVTDMSADNIAQDVQAESHDCHMDQSDWLSSSDNDECAKSPEVLVCAAAGSTTPDDGPGLWMEDRQPTVVEGIEDQEEEEEEADGGGKEEGGKGHKGGKVREGVWHKCFRKLMKVLPE